MISDFISCMRETFSKAEITIARRKIIIKYEYQPAKFFCQGISGDSKSLLYSLFDNAKTTEFIRDKECCKIIFSLKEDIIDDRIIVLPAIERELTTEEVLNQMEENARASGVTDDDIANNEKFIVEFIGKWETNEELRDKIINLFDYVTDRRDDTPQSVEYSEIYRELLEEGKNISGYFDRFEISEPNSYGGGEIALIKDDNKQIIVDDTLRQSLMKIIKLSDNVSIESDEKYMDFRLYFSLE